ncbi:hypothetical protein A5634_10405 [Mycobacterium asiaticum]|uniref:PknH-like extracellular domain-containing protein n=1 Tax=Mycobacterium asiaticum TaxID=1790 RepID=A0A1A3NIW5_MYCAS|nr:sensor domain-containing protein [Mycobacterium asiaticum]OBK21275.1 hypothetical protein A5634_10405 [Mycobacterium asiaticum]
MNRKVLVCALITIAAVVVIVVTAIVKSGGDSGGTKAEHGTPLAPGITNSLLSEAELRSAVGDTALVTTNFTGRMGEKPAEVDPAVCEGASTIAAPGSYIGVNWLATRVISASSPKGQGMHYAAEGLTALDTPEAVRRYMDKVAQAWQDCLRQTYSTTYADGSKGTWKMSGINQSDTALTAKSSPVDSKYTCQHALRAEAQYIIDVLVCGNDVAYQAQTAADRLVAKLKKNMQAL